LSGNSTIALYQQKFTLQTSIPREEQGWSYQLPGTVLHVASHPHAIKV